MAAGTMLLLFYAVDDVSGVTDDIVDAIQRADDEHRLDLVERPQSESTDPRVIVSGSVDSFRVEVTADDTDDPADPDVTVAGITDKVHPKWIETDADTNYWLDTIFEIACRLSVILDAEYALLVNTQNDPMARMPQRESIGSEISTPPRIGIYSDEVLERLGGIESLFDGNVYYVGDLERNKTVVVESPTPWTNGGWQPPTDAEYIDSATIDEDPGLNPR